MFDALSAKVLGTIALGGKPEFAAADDKGRVYVNIEDTSEIIEIDSHGLAVIKRISLKPCKDPTGMAFDAEHHRVFAGCRSKVMVVLDAETGEVMAFVPIGEGVDGIGFDAGTGLRSVPMVTALLPSCKKHLPAGSRWPRQSSRSEDPARWPSIQRPRTYTCQQHHLRRSLRQQRKDRSNDRQ